MTPEHEIGRVIAVDTAHVTVELNEDLKALTRSTYEGTTEVGRINSYVIIPVGSRQIVAMVTRVMMSQAAQSEGDESMVQLPSTSRQMRATMIGSIDENRFRQGITLFPVLDSKVYLASKQDLDAIFGSSNSGKVSDPEHPGYCVAIGQSAIFQDYTIFLDPDAFFGKHAAIIGSTGSGKSCSIATILQSVISREDVKQTRFVILDTNGEYRAAFQMERDGKFEEAIPGKRSLYIPTDTAEQGHLSIPYWFMSSDDFVRLFRAAPGVQRPILLKALGAARISATPQDGWRELRDEVLRESNRILAAAASSERGDAKMIRQLCDGMETYLKGAKKEVGSDFAARFGLQVADLAGQFVEIQKISREGLKKEGQEFESYAAIDVAKRKRIEAVLRPILGKVSKLPPSTLGTTTATADAPSYFSKVQFRHEHIESAVNSDDAGGSRARDNASTMLMRIHRLLEDSRFDFLFGSPTVDLPDAKNSLATFLRDLMGLAAVDQTKLSDEASVPKNQLPFYDRQRAGAGSSNVVVVDLSLLASEVLENVTALVGRLIHEFLQRISDPVSGVARGEFPVVLVLEEAQNYIREGVRTEEDSISKQVFERIAREGRKFGLGLVVASQRPSELSKTVLSQCNSFVVHRLQNPEDLRYFKEIVPGIYGQLLSQLPALAPRNALVLGECVQAPVLVEMRKVDPAPRSKDPKFFKSWTTEAKTPDVEALCAKWEGHSNGDDNRDKAQKGEAPPPQPTVPKTKKPPLLGTKPVPLAPAVDS